MKSVTHYSAWSTLGACVTKPCQPLLLLAGAAALLTGCGAGTLNQAATSAPVGGAAIRGTAFGGQQPVVGAVIQLYAANLTGYGLAASPLIPANAVTTGASGGFTFSGQYTCPTPDAPVYLVASGGNPGVSASNPNLTLMAALGSCSALQANESTIFIQMNEVTTVAAAYALAPFMTGVAGMSTSASNTAGLNFAFADVNQLVNNATGASPGTALPAGATLPLNQINTLADAVSACINSTGGTAGDASACGSLFAAATPPSGTAPTDTVSALINIVQHPGQNVAAIYALATAKAPYQPTLAVAPNDWTLAVTYTGGSLSAPSAVAVDAGGNVWITNGGAHTVTELAHSGAVLTTSAAVLSGPSAIAIDAAGGPWITDSTANMLTHLSDSAIVTSSVSGGLNLPAGIAIDPQGNLWVANSGTAGLSEFTSGGSLLSGNGYAGSGINNPLGVAISH